MVSLLFLALMACSDSPSGVKRPVNILSDSLFVELLIDLSLAESAANTNIKAIQNAQFDSVYAFQPLLDHKIRNTQYDSTLEYYSSNIEAYKILYNEVLDRLSAMKATQTK